MKQRKIVTTVRELREYLDNEEAQWTEKDEEYLGEFENQAFAVVNCAGYSVGMEVEWNYGCYMIFRMVDE